MLERWIHSPVASGAGDLCRLLNHFRAAEHRAGCLAKTQLSLPHGVCGRLCGNGGVAVGALFQPGLGDVELRVLFARHGELVFAFIRVIGLDGQRAGAGQEVIG